MTEHSRYQCYYIWFKNWIANFITLWAVRTDFIPLKSYMRFPILLLSLIRTVASLSLSLSLSPPLPLSLSPVDKTWAERMWNIYSALAQSTTAAHTLYLPRREILSVLPLPPTPPESLSPHWPELNTNYMSHCSAFTATLKPAAPVPNISPQPGSVSAGLGKKKTCVSWAATCAFDSLLISFFFCILIEEVMQINFAALDFTQKKTTSVLFTFYSRFCRGSNLLFNNNIFLVFIQCIYICT